MQTILQAWSSLCNTDMSPYSAILCASEEDLNVVIGFLRTMLHNLQSPHFTSFWHAIFVLLINWQLIHLFLFATFPFLCCLHCSTLELNNPTRVTSSITTGETILLFPALSPISHRKASARFTDNLLSWTGQPLANSPAANVRSESLTTHRHTRAHAVQARRAHTLIFYTAQGIASSFVQRHTREV